MQSKGCLQGNKKPFINTRLASFCLQTVLVLLNHTLGDGGFSSWRLLSPVPLTAHRHLSQRSLRLRVLAEILMWTPQNLFWADLAKTVGRKWVTGPQNWWIRRRRWGGGAGKGPVAPTQEWVAGEKSPPSHAKNIFSHRIQHRTYWQDGGAPVH